VNQMTGITSNTEPSAVTFLAPCTVHH
jgi:hypothetical protein